MIKKKRTTQGLQAESDSNIMEESRESGPHKAISETASTTNSCTTMRTNTTWRYDVFGPKRLGKGNMLFTGPDGIRDHRVKVSAEPYQYIGEGAMSPEGTSEVAYLWRRPTSMPHPAPKSRCAGEIGWSVPNLLPGAAAQRSANGANIQLGEFRQALENKHTHLFQGAWYPGPNEQMIKDSDATLVMNVYDYNPQHINRPPTRPPNRLDSMEGNANANNSNNNRRADRIKSPLPKVGSANELARRYSNGSSFSQHRYTGAYH